MKDLERQQKIVREAREFTSQEVRPYATEFEMNQGIPQKLISRMAKKGYLAASIPKEYGGLGLNSLNYGYLTEAFGQACCSTRSILTVHTSLVAETITRWGSEDQKQRWLPPMASGEIISAFALTEPDIGSDAKNINTTYVKGGNVFILSGRKKWITLGMIADMFLVIARRKETISAFMVNSRSEGIMTHPIKGLLAGRAAYIAEIEFDNVEVGEENLIGSEGCGFSLIANTALDNGRYSIAWAGIGIAQEAIEAMVSYARKRSQFGQKIYNFQLIQGIIAEAVTHTHAARSLCCEAGRKRDQRDEDAVMETTIAKYFASKVAMKVAMDAVQVHGGNGCCNTYPVERLFREAKILEIIEGTSQIQQEIISRYGLRRYYNLN